MPGGPKNSTWIFAEKASAVARDKCLSLVVAVHISRHQAMAPCPDNLSRVSFSGGEFLSSR